MRAQDAAVRAASRRAAGVRRRQRAVGAGRAARARRGVRRPARRLRLRPRGVRQRGRHQPGGRVLALRDVAARARVRARLGDRPATARSTPCGREAYIEVDPVMGHDLSFPFNMVKRGWRAVDVPRRARDGEDGPLDRGRVGPQAADDVPRVADRPARRPAGPARLPAAVRADGALAPRAALRDAAAARRRRAGDARAARARAARGLAALAQAALLAGAARGRPRALAAAAARPLLRAHHRVARRRALRPPAPRHRRRAGTRRRARGEPVPRARAASARSTSLGAALGLRRSPRRCSALAALAIRLEGGGHFIYRQRRVGRDGVPFDLYKLRTMVTGAETMGAGLIVDAGDDRITKVGALLRRTSLDELPNLINVLRGEMSLVGPRPTVQVQVDRYTRAPAPPARRAPGHHGLGPGQRPRLAALARADRARPRLPRARLAAPRPLHPRRQRPHGRHGPRALPRRDRRLARAARGAGSHALCVPPASIRQLFAADRPARRRTRRLPSVSRHAALDRFRPRLLYRSS